MDGRVHDEASRVTVEGDEILLDGPDGLAVSMTPRAAAETGQRLIEAALEASQYQGPPPDDETASQIQP